MTQSRVAKPAPNHQNTDDKRNNTARKRKPFHRLKEGQQHSVTKKMAAPAKHIDAHKDDFRDSGEERKQKRRARNKAKKIRQREAAQKKDAEDKKTAEEYARRLKNM